MLKEKFELRFLSIFAITWLLVGFTLGTLTLLGPVRAVVSRLRANGVSSGVESATVGVIILVFVAVSAGMAWGIANFFRSKRHAAAKTLVALALVVAAVTANLVWTNPALMRKNMGTEEALAQFTFGPYPDEAKLRDLKARGFTAVVSLLHPAVVPFEPQLLAAERRHAAAVGIELIHTPMLPWVSDNTSSIAKLQRLVEDRAGRYYVHCYLGLDRVMIVKRLVEQKGGTAALTTDATKRKLASGTEFERGEVVMLDATTFVTPYPTQDEFVRYVLGGQIDHVFALLDPNDREQSARIAEEKTMLERYGLRFDVLAASDENYDPAALLRAAQQVRAAPGRKLVHQFFGATSGKAPLAAAFIEAWRGGQPPLLPTLQTTKLDGGSVSLLNSFVALGPRPAGREFGAVLERAGVRRFICVGKGTAACASDAALCREHDLAFTAVGHSPEELIVALRSGGPYYVYGTDETALRAALQAGSTQ